MQLESNRGAKERLPSAGHRVQGLSHARGWNGQRYEARLDRRSGGELVVDVAAADDVLCVDVTLALTGCPETLVAVRTQEWFGPCKQSKNGKNTT